MNCPRNDIVLLPILFTVLSSHKVRPAIVIGHGPDPCDIFVVPVTSRLQQTMFPQRDWKSRGLNDPSAVNGQLATVETKLVHRVTGHLDKSDAANLDRHLRQWLKLGSSKEGRVAVSRILFGRRSVRAAISLTGLRRRPARAGCD